MKIGLYGGSFDPAHEGHLHVAETALNRLGLDRLIFLVSPGNPLKQRPGWGVDARVDHLRTLTRNPRLVASGAEARLGTRYTVDTLRILRRRHPGVRFVWVMGADNLAGFHRWKGWTKIFRTVPIAVVPRPGYRAKARLAPAPRRFTHARLRPGAGKTLPLRAAPAWIDLPSPLNAQSSTALRAATLVAAPPPC